MRLIRPLPGALTRPVSALLVILWLAQMGVLLRRTVLEAGPLSLATDLSRYGTAAHWRGIYYRGEKIGFSVSQVQPLDDGFEIQEDGQIQMSLMGAITAARLRTRVRTDRAFAARSFSFSLDPGTGAINVDGTLEGTTLRLAIVTKAGRREETRELREAPSLALNLSKRLAAQGLEAGKRLTVPIFDPATLQNSEMTVEVEAREVVRVMGRPVPAFRVRTRFAGIVSQSWITDVGEVVREESPMGLVVLKESRETATALAVSREVQLDMYEAAAIVSKPERRIDDPASVDYLRVRLEGTGFSGPDLQGAGQRVDGEVFEMRDSESIPAQPAPPELAALLAPETFVESDAAEIVAEAERALAGIKGARARAERLVRHVNALLEKRPTVSLPSASEVLRTRVGDCNEHTTLFVALARAAGIPARMAVGLVHLRGAFYYHAWAEVWIETAPGRGRWVSADPTLNQFPADLTHIRLTRGGLDRQAAIVGMIGRAKLEVLDLRMRPGTAPVLVGRQKEDMRPLEIPLPSHEGSGRTCWSKPR